MAESNKNEVPAIAKVFGWISMVVSCLGALGILLIIIAGLMPSYHGGNAQIHSEDARRTVVFFFGAVFGYFFAPQGCLAGIISLIIMLVKRSTKKIWLPLTGTAIGFAAFIGTALAMVYMFG